MSTLFDITKGFKSFRHAGDIGIEIETESDQAYNYPEFKYWTTHQDGSLRSNRPVEYVLSRPYNYEEIPACLKEFQEKTSHIKFNESVYTSVHVHLNVSRMKINHMFNLAVLWLMFEEALVRHCGPDRDGNLFCLKNTNAELQYKTVIDLAQNLFRGHGVASLEFLDQNSLKYSSMNMSCINKFGSLEFRTFKGTTDIKEIKDWIDLLWCLRTAAVKYDNPRDIIQACRWKPEDFIDEVFGKRLSILKDRDVIKEDLRNGLWYGAKIAGCIPSWKTLESLKLLSPTEFSESVRKISSESGGRRSAGSPRRHPRFGSTSETYNEFIAAGHAASTLTAVAQEAGTHFNNPTDQ